LTRLRVASANFCAQILPKSQPKKPAIGFWYAQGHFAHLGSSMSLKHAVPIACIALAMAFSPSLLVAKTAKQAMPETMHMLRHAISIPTVKGKANVPKLAQYLAKKMESAGFTESDIQIIPVGETAALVVRYPGTTDAKPIVFNGHMDVVAASNPKAWKYPPFKLTEADGYLHGRGVADMKTGVITLVETFMRLKRAGYQPQRTLILALTGDEETDEFTTGKLAKQFKDAAYLIDADGGSGVLDKQGKPVMFGVEAAEKGYTDFLLTTTSPGGHSSRPSPKHNAIDRLAQALVNIRAWQFPVRHNQVSLITLKTMAEHAPDSPLTRAMRNFAANPDDADAVAVLTANPGTVGLIRTTCIATMLKSGHARNALPENATANVNCRVFPGETINYVKNTLVKVVDDASVKVTRRPPRQPPGPITRPSKAIMSAIAASVHQRYPGLEVVPVMIGASSDMKYFRLAGIPSYGVSPFFSVPGESHAHGINEQLRASEVQPALDFWYSFMQRVGGGGGD
jgi:acetylornithine deacetylase/succinyl-diaminopimelate desuccinylase-like protein